MDQQVFEEQLDEDYDPTPEEIADYAKWLGLDPATDSHLLWIAREGLKAPLPEEWKPCRSPEQGLYYYNFVTGQSSWEHPSDSYYKKLFQEEKCKPAHPAQAGLAPAQKQQLFAGNGAGRSASSGSIFAGSAACQGFSGPVAALFGAGSVPASMPGTRPGTAQQHASWDARQLRRQQPSGLASNFLGRQLSAGSRHDLTGGAASVGSSMAPSPRRVSESASFAARMSTQTSGHFEDVRKPGTAPASGAKKRRQQPLPPLKIWMVAAPERLCQEGVVTSLLPKLKEQGHGLSVCAGLPARQKELEEAPAEDHPAAAPAASAAALSELASQVPAQAAGTASDDDADMLECRLAAAATAAATKAHTALLREQALKQKQEASEARLEMQLKMDARHMDAISQSMRSMKENVRQIQQLEHQGRQLSKAVGLQHESGALVTGILTAATAGATTMLSGPGATGMAAWERVSEPAGRSCEGGAAEQLEVERDLDGRMEQCLRQLQHALLQLTGP
ncbi:hypothetical protein N2152v2_000813 [Parachlorella kessleri]